MKDIIKKSLIYGGISVGALGVGVGASVGIILPKAIEAKDALEGFVSEGGSSANLKSAFEKNKKLKVVALGDSVTAGYNGYLGTESYSYVDFLVDGLRTSLGGKEKVEYKNFSQSGLRLADYKKILEDPNLARQLKDADIVPITIGANDVLAVLELFGLPYNMAQTVLDSAKDILSKTVDPATLKFSTTKEAKNVWAKFESAFYKGSKPGQKPNVVNEVRDENANFVFSKKDAQNMFEQTINDMIDVSDGDSGQMFNLDDNWKDQVFDLVKRELATMMRDLHIAAPNAQIIVIGHPLPFAQFPIDVLFEKNKSMGNKNLLELFNHLLDSMKEGVESSLGTNGFVDFYKADELPGMAPYSWSLKNLDEKYNVYLQYKKDLNVLETKYETTSKQDDKDKIKTEMDNLKTKFYKTAIYDDTKTPGADYKFKNVTYDTDDNYAKSTVGQPMSNILDIHPTIYGQSLIGKSLFDIYAKKIGISEVDIKKGNKAIDDPKFIKIDHDPNIVKGTVTIPGKTPKYKRYLSASEFNELLNFQKNPDGILKSIKGWLNNIKSDTPDDKLQVSIIDFLSSLAFGFAKQLGSTKTLEDIKNAINLAKGIPTTGIDSTIKLFSSTTKGYVLAKTNLYADATDALDATKWSIYGISAYTAFIKTISSVLENPLVKGMLGS